MEDSGARGSTIGVERVLGGIRGGEEGDEEGEGSWMKVGDSTGGAKGAEEGGDNSDPGSWALVGQAINTSRMTRAATI
jgi:hypothetical protein